VSFFLGKNGHEIRGVGIHPQEQCLAMPPEQTPPKPPQPSAELAPDEFYFDGPYLVFTAAYHLRRGFCCNSGCRHCPYQQADTVRES
jgi:hypothetical protein